MSSFIFGLKFTMELAMARQREMQKLNRHRRIVDAASRLFSATDYQSVRMEDIAEIAEVSVGTVYNYFNSKGDLLTAIVARALSSQTKCNAGIFRSCDGQAIQPARS